MWPALTALLPPAKDDDAVVAARYLPPAFRLLGRGVF
jgi:hypothetical protein